MITRNRLLLFAGVTVVLLVAAFAAARQVPRAEAARPDVAALAVDVATASYREMAEPFEVGGVVRARETATITSRIVAEVREVRVRPGDRVRAGQALVVLDARDLTAGRLRAQAGVTAALQAADATAAERQAADAALALASANYRRILELREKNSATASEMDRATAELRAAESRVKSTQAQVSQAAAGIEVARAASQAAVVGESYATLVAPFDGVVIEKLIDAGNMASPGVPLLTVEDPRSLRLEVRVDESRASLVNVGQQVRVVFDAANVAGADVSTGESIGRVAELARGLDPNAHAFVAKIDLPAGSKVRSGMFGRATIAGRSRRVLAVPEKSIVRRGQLTSAFVVDRSNTARLRLLTIGEAADGSVEVRAGLDPGERVVVAPPPGLVDGGRVHGQEGRQ